MKKPLVSIIGREIRFTVALRRILDEDSVICRGVKGLIARRRGEDVIAELVLVRQWPHHGNRRLEIHVVFADGDDWIGDKIEEIFRVVAWVATFLVLGEVGIAHVIHEVVNVVVELRRAAMK